MRLAMTPLQTEFLSRIGKTLLEVQFSERLLQICISYFLPNAKTVEEIEAQAEKDRTKTLGELCKLMRSRIAIAATFDEQLKQFVSDRNALAHHLLKVKDVSFSTEDGLKKGIEFLKGLEALSLVIRKVIQGLMDAIDDLSKGDEERDKYKEVAKVIFGGD
jgi:hypothetical protein